MTEQIRRVNNVVMFRSVEVDPSQAYQLFTSRPEKISVRCEPGACVFDFGNVTVKIYDEYVDYELQEEALDRCNCGVWDSNNFFATWRPGVITFVNMFTVRKLIEKRMLGTFVPPKLLLLPGKLAQRLKMLTPEEEAELMEWLMPYIRASCASMLALINQLWIPREQYERLMQLLSKIGELDAVSLNGVCDVEEDVRCCDIYESRGDDVYLVTHCPFSDRGDNCTFVVWLN